MVCRIHSVSDKGPVLNVNEDDCVTDIKNSLFGVIDGHGGSGIGDKGFRAYQEDDGQ